MAFESTWRQHETRGFRGLAALIAALLMPLLVIVPAAMFLWPHTDSETGRIFNAGNSEKFVLGTPVLFSTDEGIKFSLVRLDEKTFIALNAVDPRSGCSLVWRPDFMFNDKRGWFRDPCYGSTYDIRGVRVFGPTPANMDRFDVHVRGDSVIVTADMRFIKRTVGENFQPRPYASPPPKPEGAQ